MSDFRKPGPESTSQPPSAGPKHTAFLPLQQTAFSTLEHAAFLKGLLKPFKGKGDLSQFALSCRQLRGNLIQLAVGDVLAQAERYPFTLLPIRLTCQATGSGTVFLRWSRTDRSKMGVDLWDELLGDPRTPDSLASAVEAHLAGRVRLPGGGSGRQRPERVRRCEILRERAAALLARLSRRPHADARP